MSTPEKPLVSFIVLHYQNSDAINLLATELFTHLNDIELIVVDNSSDFVLQNTLSAKNIHILSPGYNSGFARGVNMGLRNSRGQFLALINQDIAHIEPLRFLIEQLDPDKPNNLIKGVKLVDPDGHFQQSIWLDYPSLKQEWIHSTFYSYLIGQKKHKRDEAILHIHQQSGYIERCNAAFILFHRNLIDRDNLYWDKDFFLYGEDVDWAWRCNRAGWKFYYEATIQIQHEGSASSTNSTVKELQVILSDFLFVSKHHSFLYSLFFFGFVLISSLFDLFLLQRAKRKDKPTDSYMWLNRKMKVYLVKKYGYLLLWRKKHTHPQQFMFNCYQNDQTFASTLSASSRF